MADNDILKVRVEYIGTIWFKLSDVGLTWPPPKRIVVENGQEIRAATQNDDSKTVFRRISMSRLTDDQAEGMDCVARGAEYQYEHTLNVDRRKVQ